MATLTWDEVGERIFQTGVDRGVLYLQDGTAVPWNGLTGIEDSSNGELKSYYLDGVKFLETLTPRDFVGKLKAYTYPEEFDSVTGVVSVVEGFDAYEQPPKSFSLSYRTKIGNDIDGVDHGYKIHILYNLLAEADSYAYSSIDSGVKPIEFSWNLTGTPPKIDRFRPTVHVTIDSTKTPPDVLTMVENKLYGTASGSSPSLPTFQELSEYFGYLGALIIIDDGNGVWTAVDESNGYITMLDATTFFIDNADVTYLDTNTYTISSTNVV
jgi:hypothetical protein